jgi:hypothetical protein
MLIVPFAQGPGEGATAKTHPHKFRELRARRRTRYDEYLSIGVEAGSESPDPSAGPKARRAEII